MDNNILVIYHDDCIDGFSAAWAVWYAFDGDVQLMPMAYDKRGEFNIEACKDAIVYIVDFSFGLDDLTKMAEVAQNIVLLDHHKTAEEELMDKELPDNVSIIFDKTRSGAKIAWGYFNGDAPNKPIDLVEDRDLWNWSFTESRAYNAALALYPRDMETWSLLMFGHPGHTVEDLVKQGNAVLAYQESRIQEYLKHVFFESIQIDEDGTEIEVPCINCPPWEASDVGNAMVLNIPEAQTSFAMTMHIQEGQLKVSLRSHAGGMDVSIIAKVNGGGGHRNAAGFVIKEEIFYDHVPS